MARITTLALGCALWLVIAASPAAAEHVQCGAVITEDTVLDSDLECPFEPELEGVAITIAADDVTLDLGGHRVVGPLEYSDTAGVMVRGFDRAVVRNGYVSGFSIQIVVRDSSGTTVRGLRTRNVLLWGDDNAVVHGWTAGIDVRGHRNLIAHNVISGPFNSQGMPDRLAVEGGLDEGGPGRGNVIVHNRIVGVVPNHDEDAEGMSLRLSGGVVAHNTIAAGDWGPPEPFQSTRGMTLVGEDTLVKRNVATGHEDGFYLWGSFQVVGNTASDNFEDGIDVPAAGSTLKRNVAYDNGDLGIEAHPDTVDAGNNRAAGNGNPAQCVGVRCR